VGISFEAGKRVRKVMANPNERERVLVVQAVAELARAAARSVMVAGGEPIVAASVAEARQQDGTFARGIFSFDLPDGSGIVLAANLLVAKRVGRVDFFHPEDEAAARERRAEPRPVRPTAKPHEGPLHRHAA
jgi:UDP-N-acetyl-D-mannosaminuronic acid transferase (WecB/TagA/CpsF family)